MSDNVPSMNLYSNITVPVRGQLISLMQMKNKDIYWELIGNKEIQASAINTWIDLYPFLHAVKWYIKLMLYIIVLLKPTYNHFSTRLYTE